MLEFIQIEISELKKGGKYKIIEKVNDKLSIIFIGKYDGSFNGKYKGTFGSYFREQYLLWHHLYYIIRPILDGNVEFTNPTYYGTLEMNIVPTYTRKMYKLSLSKEKIQNAMELRAINLILQIIIGDKSFVY